MTVTLLFGGFLLLLLLNAPVPFALGISSALAIWLGSGQTLMIIPQRIVPALDSFALLAIPLFILTGEILNTGGMARRMVRLANALVGHVNGGLAHANILASMLFGTISGSASADTAAIGPILIPAMTQSGYDKRFATVVTITSSPLGVIIPPSIIMVLYGWLSGASVARMFAAGVIPGILIGFGLMGLSHYISRVNHYGMKRPFEWKELLQAAWEALPAILMPVVVLGGILGGIFTPTEAAAIAVAYGVIVAGFVYRELKLQHIPEMLRRTCLTTGGVMLLIAFAATFGWIMTAERVPFLITQFFLQFIQTPTLVLMLVMALCIVLGMFLTPTSALIILVPILQPVARLYGIDIVHLGIILIATLAMGHFTPPVGLSLFIGSGISGIPIADLIRPLMPFIVVMLAVVMVIALMPGLIWFLPNLLFGG